MADAFGPNLPIVIEILQSARKPLHVRRICELAADRLPTKSKTPVNSVSRDLALSIQRDPNTPFSRHKRGVYGLASWLERDDAAAG